MEPFNTTLTRWYYLYIKSSKKHCKLKNFCDMLKGELEMYTSRVRPMKATGARWIDHKLWTMDNLIRNLDFIHLNNIISTTTVPILKKKQLKQRNSVYTQKSDINIINILHLVKFRKLSKNHDLVFQLPT